MKTRISIFLAWVLWAVLVWNRVQAISPRRIEHLSRDQLIALDSEVKDYYDDTYHQLDSRNVSFDEQLFKSIRAIRHTTVINHNEFRYTSDDYKRQAMGSTVDKELCKQQLFILAKIGEKMDLEQAANRQPAAHLSIVDFFDSSARAGSGVLNGNFVWLGSYSSCVRAKIPFSVVESYLTPDIVEQTKVQLNTSVIKDIKGRYCVSHLRAKSWPKWDIYFEDRITLRRGICMPEPCHTAIYEQDPLIQQLVDYLSRHDLSAPYNSPRYETSGLYCLPDEDSPYRQLDTGAKLFLLFVVCWALFTIWANIKFYQRAKTMQKLRETVDIRMIINENKDDQQIEAEVDDEDDDEQRNSRLTTRTAGRKESGAYEQRPRSAEPATHSRAQSREEANVQVKTNKGFLTAGARQLKKQLTKSLGSDSNNKSSAQKLDSTNTDEADNISLATSVQSSYQNTPLASDVEETDVEFVNLFRADRKKSLSKSRVKPAVNFDYTEPTCEDSIDLVRAFSLETNFNYLISPRSTTITTERDVSQSRGSVARLGGNRMLDQQRGSQQLMAVPRRTSSSNDKLIKELQQQDSGVAIVSRSEIMSEQKAHAKLRGRRVNVEVLDGLKVIATSYIVFGHTLMFFFGCVSDLRFSSERMFDLTLAASINTLQVVSLFYIITGCLLTYLSFSRTKPKQLQRPIFWIAVVVGRYFRLMPAYALAFWFSRHVATHTGAGRDWYDYRTDTEHARGYCGQESWWTMWTMSAADVKIPMHCIPQAWYLSDDFRTLLVLPFYIYLLARSALLGYGAIFATFIYSTTRLVVTLREADIDYKILIAWKPHVYSLMVDRLHYVYTNFSVRISTYLFGVVIGHLLYLYETKHIKEWPRPVRLFGMKLVLMLGFVLYFGAKFLSNPYVHQFLPPAEQVDSDTAVLLVPIFKIFMEICLSIMILLLVTGGGSTVVRAFLSSSVMKILCNISYAVFLTHVEVMYKMPGLRFESDYWYLFIYSVFFITLSHVAAFFIHLLYEMPINNILRTVFKKLFSATTG